MKNREIGRNIREQQGNGNASLVPETRQEKKGSFPIEHAGRKSGSRLKDGKRIYIGTLYVARSSGYYYNPQQHTILAGPKGLKNIT